MSELSRVSVRHPVKRGSDHFLDRAAAALRTHWRSGRFEDWFGPGVTLVPVPRSSPLVTGGLWPSDRICTHLVRHQLTRDSLPLLARTKPVMKAAYASPGSRPSVSDHRNSIRIDLDLGVGEHILVVDDIVTRGDTLFACVMMLQGAYPDVEVRGFVLVRTMGLIPEIEDIIDPVAGTITETPDGRVERDP